MFPRGGVRVQANEMFIAGTVLDVLVIHAGGDACNVENSCNSMTDEIQRGCAQLGRDAPSFCTLYR